MPTVEIRDFLANDVAEVDKVGCEGIQEYVQILELSGDLHVSGADACDAYHF